jgi:hypothetical protein
VTDVTTSAETFADERDLLPDELDYTNADVDRDLAKPRLRANTWYRGKVTSARPRVWGKGSIYLQMTVNPLDVDGKTRGPSAQYKLTLPFANPKKSGHTAPNTIGFCHNFLNATYPTKFPTFPTRNKDGTYSTADGQIVSQQQADAIKREITVSIRDAMKTYYRDPTSLIDEVFYFQVSDNDYRDVVDVGSEPPVGVEVRMSDFADTVI